MIDKNDLKYIHSDLYDLVKKLVEREEYEKCKLANDYMILIQNYLSGKIGDEDIINPLFDLCFSRYAILRLLSVRGKRYVVFMLPNSSVIFFDVEPDRGEPSGTWKMLQDEYDRITQEVTKNIIRTM